MNNMEKILMNNSDINSVAQNNQRNYAKRLADYWFGRNKTMWQAKTLTDKDLKKVLAYISTRKHAARDRAMLLTTVMAGTRIGEAAALRIKDVLAADGTIKEQLTLGVEQTKGNEARVLMLPSKLRDELRKYLIARFGINDLIAVTYTDMDIALFYTQKEHGRGYTGNTAAQHFHTIYKEAGISGASSHSGRRTFITNLANKGVGARVLMALAGHKNLGTTQKYIDCNEAIMRAAVELI